MELNAKQKAFCRKYVELGNACRAYMEVYGCKQTTAQAKAYKMLQTPKIKKEVSRVRDEAFAHAQMGTNEILSRLASVARGELQEEVVGFTPQGEPIKTTKQVTPKDQIKALELLGKRYGLFKENVQVNGGKSIKINVVPAKGKK